MQLSVTEDNLFWPKNPINKASCSDGATIQAGLDIAAAAIL